VAASHKYAKTALNEAGRKSNNDMSVGDFLVQTPMKPASGPEKD
jgi:hypothetical protein